MVTKIANILFVVSGALWAIEGIPQWRKILRRKSVEDISVFFYVICCIAYILFLIGAGLIKNIYLCLAHIPAFINISFILFLILKYRKKK